MYGKHHRSMYTGSMYGAGPMIFAVWGYVIAHTIKGRVELNPTMIAHALGGKEEDVVDAILFLEKPDAKSRNEAHDGSRLVKEGQFQYLVPSHEIYRAMRDEDERREYNRQKKREERERNKLVSSNESNKVKHGQPLSAHTEAEAEAEAEADSPIVFQTAPLALSELSLFWNENGNGLPKVLVLPQSQRRKEKLRIKELGIDKLKAAVLKMAASHFCNGGGPRGWKATYDFLIKNDSNAVNILEGKYDNAPMVAKEEGSGGVRFTTLKPKDEDVPY